MLFGAYDVVTHGAPRCTRSASRRALLARDGLASTHAELTKALKRYRLLRDEHLAWLQKAVELDFETQLTTPPMPLGQGGGGGAVAVSVAAEGNNNSSGGQEDDQSIWASASAVDTAGSTTAMDPGSEASVLLSRISQLSMQYVVA